ncbi:unnamed protein product [Amoebophrya sp. A120]|nr:unnamed protein product [Amoebophrya sp. A120]|eukprot:GSA120T00023412001.1
MEQAPQSCSSCAQKFPSSPSSPSSVTSTTEPQCNRKMVFQNFIKHPVYQNCQTILAPMVRASTLPLRQVCRDFGCDILYNEEIIDKRVLYAQRFENPHYPGLVEYFVGAENFCAESTTEINDAEAAALTQQEVVEEVEGGGHQGLQNSNSNSPERLQKNNIKTRGAGALVPSCSQKPNNSNSGDKKSIFRTTWAEIAENRTIFQLGTCDKHLALQAAQVVINDVAGIDVNMGCPKSFSVKGGMGAALLEKPDLAAEIVGHLRAHLPREKSVTCKIRLDPDLTKTKRLVQKCLAAGADAVAIHMRFVPDRPKQPARWPLFGKLLALLKADLGGPGKELEVEQEEGPQSSCLPLIANGDFFTVEQVNLFQKMFPGIPVMVARGAQWNPGLFWEVKHSLWIGESTVADSSSTHSAAPGAVAGTGGQLSTPVGDVNKQPAMHPVANVDKTVDSASSLRVVPTGIDGDENEIEGTEPKRRRLDEAGAFGRVTSVSVPAPKSCTENVKEKMKTTPAPHGRPYRKPTREDCFRLYLQKGIDCGASLQEIKWNLQEILVKETNCVFQLPQRQCMQKLQGAKSVHDLVDMTHEHATECLLEEIKTNAETAAASGVTSSTSCPFLSEVRYDKSEHPEKAHTIAYMKEVLYEYLSELNMERRKFLVEAAQTTSLVEPVLLSVVETSSRTNATKVEQCGA